MKTQSFAALAVLAALAFAVPAHAEDASQKPAPAKPQTDAKPHDAKPHAAKPAADAKPKADLKAEPKPEPKADLKSEPKPEPKADLKSEPKAEPKADPAAKAAPPAATTTTAATPPAPPLPPDRAEAVRRANAFFNASPVMTADFIQIGGDGKRSEGKLHVQRAGRVRFEYAAPATMEVVSDGAQVLVRDRKLGTYDLYFINQTPLKFLLKEKIDLEHDSTVQDVATDDSGTTISLEDKLTFGGTSHVKLIFDSKTFKLKQWQITDPQGYETLISLFNLDQKQTPDPALFKIDMTRKAEPN